MKLVNKIICIGSMTLLPTSAFAAGANHVDALGYGGYSQADQWSDSSADNTYGSLTGFNAGAMILITLMNRPIAPVVGFGGDYMQLKGSINDSTNTIKNNNTLTSVAGTGHAGLRAVGANVRLYLLGNGGYGFSDKIVNDITLVSGGTTVATTTNKMANHYFYGGTAALLFSIGQRFKIGVSGVYNLHSTKLQDQTAGSTTAEVTTTFQEVSGNLVLGLSF